MKHYRKLRTLGGLAAAGLMLHANPALACAACYGKSDSSLATGMNWGIFALLGCISMVLVGFAGFGVFLMRRSAAVNATTNPETSVPPTPKA